jgi:hypothetical protein
MWLLAAFLRGKELQNTLIEAHIRNGWGPHFLRISRHQNSVQFKFTVTKNMDYCV